MTRHAKSLLPGLAGCMVWMLLAAGPALAQRTTATIRGRVTLDAALAPPGTTIVAENVGTGFQLRDRTRADGSYVLTGVAPGQYLITVTTPDSREVLRLVAVEVGQTVALDIELSEEWVDLAGSETIEITGRLAEVKTSEVATNITREQLESLPQNNRNVLSFAQLAPGVRVSTDEFRQNFSSGALQAAQTNVFVDGVSLKNNVIDGGVVGQDASRGGPFPQLAVAGIRVLTQNFKAEYEQAGSAIISAITRSGGNELHSEFFSAFQHDAVIAKDIFAVRGGTPEPALARYQIGGSASGPIIEDALHFFVAYEGNYQDRANQVTLGNPTDENLDRFGDYQGSFGSPFRQHQGFGKLSWQPDERQTMDLSASLRWEDDIRSFGGATSYESAERVRNNVVTTSLRHQYRFDTAVNEATLQFLHYQFNPTVLNPDLIGQDFQGVIRIGGRDTSQDIRQRALTLRNDVSFTDLEWMGQHLVKTGIKLAFQGYSVERSQFGNPVFRYRVDPANALDFDIPFEAQYGVGDPEAGSSNTQLGLFVQDDWQVTPRLTINAGVRWDVETNPLNNDYVTPDDVRTAAQELAAMVEPINGPDFFDVDNYLTDGTQRPIFLGAIQPRLGAAYDITGDQGTVVFGGAGRYYDRTLYNTGVDEVLRQEYEVRTFRFSRDGAPRDGLPTIMFRPEYLSREGLDQLIASGVAPAPEIYLLENDTRPLHTDQLSLGVRQRIGPVNASLTLTHARSENGVGFYPANREATGDRNFIPTPGGFGNVIISADDRSSRYTGVSVTADKPYSDELSAWGIDWGMSLAYTFGVARERGDLFNFDFPTIEDSPVVPTATDERHRVVVSGVVGLPWAFKLSTLMVFGSGVPFSVSDASGGFGPQEFELRRNGGRAEKIVEFRQVDLRLAKDFEVAGQQRISAFVEVFNLFNSKNYGGYDGFIPPAPERNDNFGSPSVLVGPTRRLQVGLGYAF